MTKRSRSKIKRRVERTDIYGRPTTRPRSDRKENELTQAQRNELVMSVKNIVFSYVEKRFSSSRVGEKSYAKDLQLKEDIVSHIFLALVHASKLYEDRREAKFSTYAYKWIGSAWSEYWRIKKSSDKIKSYDPDTDDVRILQWGEPSDERRSGGRFRFEDLASCEDRKDVFDIDEVEYVLSILGRRERVLMTNLHIKGMTPERVAHAMRMNVRMVKKIELDSIKFLREKLSKRIQ